MISALERLQSWFSDHLVGVVGFVVYAAVGHAVLWAAVPNPNTGLDIGLVLFATLTAISAEQARSLRSRSFVAWLLAGLAFSVAAGAAFHSLGNEGQTPATQIG